MSFWNAILRLIQMSTNPYPKIIRPSQITLQNSIKYYWYKIMKNSKCGIQFTQSMFSGYTLTKLNGNSDMC